MTASEGLFDVRDQRVGDWDEDRNNGWLTFEHHYYRQILGYLLHKSIYIGERASVCRSLTHAVQITIERFTRA